MDIRQEFRDFLRGLLLRLNLIKKLAQLVKAYGKVKDKYVVIKTINPEAPQFQLV